MMVTAIDQRDAHICVAQRTRRCQSAEPRPQDHDVRLFPLEHRFLARGCVEGRERVACPAPCAARLAIALLYSTTPHGQVNTAVSEAGGAGGPVGQPPRPSRCTRTRGAYKDAPCGAEVPFTSEGASARVRHRCHVASPSLGERE